MMTPTNTQPIPITTHHHVVGQHASPGRSGIGPQPLVINSLPRNAMSRREYGSCPPRALMHPPNSFGSATGGVGGRMRALSDFINPDYHSSPRLKPLSSPAGGKGRSPGFSAAANAALAKWEESGRLAWRKESEEEEEENDAFWAAMRDTM